MRGAPEVWVIKWSMSGPLPSGVNVSHSTLYTNEWYASQTEAQAEIDRVQRIYPEYRIYPSQLGRAADRTI